MIRAVRFWLKNETRNDSDTLCRVKDSLPWPNREPGPAICVPFFAGSWGDGFRQIHQAPDEHCLCGYYGIRPEYIEHCLKIEERLADSLWWGAVIMWGKTVVTEWGYRAEYAKVEALFGNYGLGAKYPEGVLTKASRYGVPVLDFLLPSQLCPSPAVTPPAL